MQPSAAGRLSALKATLVQSFVPVPPQNGDAGNPPSMSFVSSHHRTNNDRAFERD